VTYRYVRRTGSHTEPKKDPSSRIYFLGSRFTSVDLQQGFVARLSSSRRNGCGARKWRKFDSDRQRTTASGKIGHRSCPAGCGRSETSALPMQPTAALLRAVIGAQTAGVNRRADAQRAEEGPAPTLSCRPSRCLGPRRCLGAVHRHRRQLWIGSRPVSRRPASSSAHALSR